MALRVLFWNVWCLPRWFTDGKYSPEERAAAVAPLVRGYDVVLLNEAWTQGAKDILRREYEYHYAAPGTLGKLFDSGLLVLSRLPLEAPSHQLYADAAGWDWLASKGVVHFRLSVADAQLDFFLTHMQAGHTKADQHARLYQHLELVKFIERQRPVDNGRVFLVGDFNTMPLQKPNKSVHCHDMDDAVLRSACYNMITECTGLADVQRERPHDVYHIFTNAPHDRVHVSYHDSHGLTDGPYLTMDIAG